MSSFCIGSISWCCFVVPLFHWCFPVPLFCGVPIVPPVSCCSASVPLFRRCSVFWYSWFYSMPPKSLDWFLYERELRLEKIKNLTGFLSKLQP